MTSKLFVLALCVAAAACASTPDNAYCGNAFALVLEKGERVSSRSPVEDFVLHEVSSGAQKVVIYEGNYPEPGGIVYRTNLDWPAVVVVHAQDAFGKAIARRLRVGTPDQSKCGTPKPDAS